MILMQYKGFFVKKVRQIIIQIVSKLYFGNIDQTK